MSRVREIARRLRTESCGQTMSEYLALTGVTTAIAILAANILGVRLREVIQGMAQTALQVVTGYP